MSEAPLLVIVIEQHSRSAGSLHMLAHGNLFSLILLCTSLPLRTRKRHATPFYKPYEMLQLAVGVAYAP